MPKQILKFPKGFLWGAASSAYQTEGDNNYNDWSAWEHSAKRQEFLLSKDLKVTDFFCGQACNFYNRFDEDFSLAKGLNHNAIRFGVEWSRIQPSEEEFDEQVLGHYEKMLQSAKYHQLTVFLTLHHYTSPLWFYGKGGFEKKENIKYFLKFAQKMVDRFSQYVDFWISINDPELYVGQRYLLAVHPPQVRSIRTALCVVNNLITCHNETYKYIHSKHPRPVSMAYNQVDLQPTGFFSRAATNFIEYISNEYVLRRTIEYCDYIGLNYYFHHHVGLFGVRKHSHSNHLVTDRGWGIHPEGLERVIMRLQKHRKPIYIVENGLADAKDTRREKFIKDHLFYTHKAIQQGADVRGYLHWSLTDNFEWEEGFAPRFGLIEIDRQNNLQRKVRPSALAFAKICKNNNLEYEINSNQ